MARKMTRRVGKTGVQICGAIGRVGFAGLPQERVVRIAEGRLAVGLWNGAACHESGLPLQNLRKAPIKRPTRVRHLETEVGSAVIVEGTKGRRKNPALQVLREYRSAMWRGFERFGLNPVDARHSRQRPPQSQQDAAHEGHGRVRRMAPQAGRGGQEGIMWRVVSAFQSERR